MSEPQPNDDTDAAMPGWVYVAGVVVIVAAVAFVVMHLAGGAIPAH
jgi:hypothetical protein